MEELLKCFECIEDARQSGKVRYPLSEIVFIVFCAMMADNDEWEHIQWWAVENKELLKDYIELANGIPSHDTIRRVMGMISPEILQQAQKKWMETLNQGDGESLKKIICIDGKTMRGNTQNGIKPNHIVSAWCRDDGFCIGQKAVAEKSNEITAIPKLLEQINIKGSVITIDAMGTQTEIVKNIREKKADYVLAVKENHKNLCRDIRQYFEDDVLQSLKDEGNYLKTVEKHHGKTDVREYYQTNKISWLKGKDNWMDLKSIGMVVRTFGNSREIRYFISSLDCNIKLFSRAVRGHWSVEAMHWQLDVTFKEDANRTIDKIAAQNQNIIRKWCLSVLKLASIGKPNTSMRGKRKIISLNPFKYLDYALSV